MKWTNLLNDALPGGKIPNEGQCGGDKTDKTYFDTFVTTLPKLFQKNESTVTPCDKPDFVHWAKLTPEQRQAIIPTIKAGHPVRIFSGMLGEMVWWTRDEQTAEVLKQDPRYQGEVIYTLAELRQIQGTSPDFLRDIHRFKKEFGARLAKAEPKPASFFISPM